MLSLPTPQDIRAQRVRLGLTQAQLADQAGVSQSLVARIELGEVDPSYSTLKSIVEALNRADRREVTLRELMTGDVANVGPDDTVRHAVETMRDRGFSQLPVIDEGVAVGSVSERDIVHALNEADSDELGQAPVRRLMGPPFPALDPGEPIEVAIRMLEDRPAVLIVEEGRVIGLITKNDLLGTLEGDGQTS